MKIGIINMQYSTHNYGALLQASAIEWAVKSLCPDATIEHINIRGPWQSPNAAKKQTVCWARGLNLFRNLIFNWPAMPRNGNFEVFSNFRSQHITLSANAYITDADFASENWDYDIVIVGSDQVFRAYYVRNDLDIYLLRFLPKKCRRIAYAASFGVDYWECKDDLELTQKAGKALAQFHSISVREGSGVDICWSEFGLDAKHVLDPTLLLGREYFDQIIDNEATAQDYPQWSAHIISDDAKLVDEIPQLAKRFERSPRNIYFQRAEKWPFRPVALFTSVPDWLALIRGTKEIVLTDSYHCVCFCILFKKEFLVFLSEDKGIGRMHSLLNLLSLEDRICSDIHVFEEVASGKRAICYETVEKILERERKKAWGFLTESLS